jgi:hypothetical protein
MKTTIFWEDKRDMAGDVMMFINNVYNGIVMYIYIYVTHIKHSLCYLGVRKGKRADLGVPYFHTIPSGFGMLNHAKSTSKRIMNRWKLPKMMRKHHLESINSWSPWFLCPPLRSDPYIRG